MADLPAEDRIADGAEDKIAAPMLVLVNMDAGSVAEAEALVGKLRDAFAVHNLSPIIRALPAAEITMLAEDFASAHHGNPDVTLVIGGGDGTIGAAAGATAASGITLGVLPLGTFNHFAKDLGLPLDLAGAVATIAAGHRRRVDLGEVNGQVFINNSSIGIYPFLVTHRDALRRRHGFGKLLATIPALWRSFRATGWHFLNISATIGRNPVRTPCIFVGNNAYDLQTLGTRAALDAGTLGICIVKRQTRLGLLILPVLAALGRLSCSDDIDMFPCAEITIASRKRRLHVALDGEVMRMRTPLRYRSRPAALSVLAPRPAAA